MANAPTPPQNPQQKMTAKRADTQRLVSLCSGFVKSKVPESNIVLEEDFAKYIPLFNKKMIEDMPKEQQDKLATDYRGRFSLQHPIKIISKEYAREGDEAAYYAEDGEQHKVIMVLPPVFKTLRTLNEAGRKMPALIDMLFNTSKDDNVIMKGKNTMYARAVAEVIHKVNPESEKDKLMAEYQQLERRVDEQNKRDAAQSEQPATPSDYHPVMGEPTPDPDSNNSPNDDTPMSSTIDW